MISPYMVRYTLSVSHVAKIPQSPETVPRAHNAPESLPSTYVVPSTTYLRSYTHQQRSCRPFHYLRGAASGREAHCGRRCLSHEPLARPQSTVLPLPHSRPVTPAGARSSHVTEASLAEEHKRISSKGLLHSCCARSRCERALVRLGSCSTGRLRANNQQFRAEIGLRNDLGHSRNRTYRSPKELCPYSRFPELPL